MPRSVVIGLRILWVLLMVVLAVLMLNNLISGWGTTLYALVVLAVMFAEQFASRRTARRP